MWSTRGNARALVPGYVVAEPAGVMRGLVSLLVLVDEQLEVVEEVVPPISDNMLVEY